MTALLSPVSEDAAPVAHLASISNAELNAAAALQERVDRKYVVTEDQLADLLDELGSRLTVLGIGGRRSFGYQSVYFDTETFESSLGAAHRRRRRFKVRTRSYLDSQTTMLEVKNRGARGRTVKRRHAHEFDHRRCLGDDGRAFVDRTIGRAGLGATLRPTLTSQYQQTTLVDLADVARLTIDSGLRRPVALEPRYPPREDQQVRDVPRCAAPGAALEQVAPHAPSPLRYPHSPTPLTTRRVTTP